MTERPRRDGDALGVQLRNVSRHFGSKTALGGVDFSVEPGSFSVLLGPSGSGKTTLLRCVAGIDFPSSGAVHIGGRSVAGPGVRLPPERRGLAMVFQDYALWPHMDALANVRFALRRRNLTKSESNDRAMRMLDRLGLGALAGRYPNELSGGEQQRVALARALVAEVGLVLFDEPLSNLDADLREQLRLEIATLVREVGATALYITHDQVEAFALADTITVMRSGKVVQSGSPEEVYRRPANTFVARFTGVAGEFPVRVVRRAEPLAEAGVGGFREPSVPWVVVPGSLGREMVATAPAATSPGAEGTVFVRPSAARLVEPGSEAHLVGEVRDAAFCGRGYEHALVVPGGTMLTRVFAEHRHRPGTSVGVELDPAGCLLFCGSVAGRGESTISVDGTAPGAGTTAEDVTAVGNSELQRADGPVPVGSVARPQQILSIS